MILSEELKLTIEPSDVLEAFFGLLLFSLLNTSQRRVNSDNNDDKSTHNGKGISEMKVVNCIFTDVVNIDTETCNY
jgi:hypothetical protein